MVIDVRTGWLVKNLKSQSDFEMLAEVLQRRLKNLNWPLPNLFVVDGGKPQVRTFWQILARNNLKIPLIGIAKNPDRLVIGAPDLPTLKLPLNNLGFNLIRAIRDESHRFAKKYHLLLRKNKILPAKANTTNVTNTTNKPINVLMN